MTIRELTAGDLSFLREMLCAAVLWRPWTRWIPCRLVLRLSQLTIYHQGWSRPGDTGFVAEDGGSPVGAVWYRLFTEDEHGDGYLDPETPELAIAVAAAHRGRGVGRSLMEAIHERARQDGLRRIALSVDRGNPAKRLYLALGYRDYEPGDGKGRMILELQ